VLAQNAHIQIEGALTSTAGLPVADGAYAMAFRVFEAPAGGDPLFEEVVLTVPVKLGVFTQVLGANAKTPLPSAIFTAQKARFISLQITGEAELPRVEIFSVPLAIWADRAGLAGSLQCTGCLDGSQLGDGAVATQHLQDAAVTGTKLAPASVSGAHVAFTYATSDEKAGEALAAKLAHDLDCTACVNIDRVDPQVLAPYAKSADLAPLATSASWTDLKAFPAACKDGEVLAGYASDGTPACVADQVKTYSGADFALSDQDCTSKGGVAAIGKDGKVLCAALARKLVAGPSSVDAGKSLVLTHGLNTMEVLATGWIDVGAGYWEPVSTAQAAQTPFNVAAAANGGLCTGQSTSYSSNNINGAYGCSNVLDGDLNDSDTASWATQGEGTGSWLNLQLPKAYLVSKMTYKQRNCACEWNKQLKLTFSDNSTQTVVLQNTQGPATYDLTPVTTTTLKIVVESVYGTTNNGACEIELLGVEPSKSIRLRKSLNAIELVNQTNTAATLQILATY